MISPHLDLSMSKSYILLPSTITLILSIKTTPSARNFMTIKMWWRRGEVQWQTKDTHKHSCLEALTYLDVHQGATKVVVVVVVVVKLRV